LVAEIFLGNSFVIPSILFISMVDSVTSLLQIWHSMLFSSEESSCKKGSAEMEKAKNKPEKTSKALLEVKLLILMSVIM